MANLIDLRPSTLNLALYAGDGVEFRLVCTEPSGDPLDVSGAVAAQIRRTRETPDPPITSFSVNMTDSYLGVIVLSLTGEQTQDLLDGASKFVGVWDVEWTPAGKEPRTICAGTVECVSDVTR